MPIDIELFQPKGTSTDLLARKLELDDGGIYWYLFPFFERLGNQTGQFIDLYGDAKFSSENLGPLDSILSEALKSLELQPDVWEQKTGEQIRPVRKTLTQTISRKDVGSFITSLQDLLEKAVTGRGVVTFTGD
jgi:hypothetical protein